MNRSCRDGDTCVVFVCPVLLASAVCMYTELQWCLTCTTTPNPFTYFNSVLYLYCSTFVDSVLYLFGSIKI